MNFRFYALNRVQLDRLDELVREIWLFTDLQGRFREGFKSFLVRPDVSLDLDKHELKAVLDKPSRPRIPLHTATLLDYVLDVFMEELNANEVPFTSRYQKISDAHIKLQESLIDTVEHRGNPVSSLFASIGGHGKRVPVNFINEYIGYRRSSSRGDIIRFYIEIVESYDPNIVIFNNEYWRYHDHWQVDGMGIYANQTLYLFGHAVDAETNESEGYRIIALKRLGRGGALIGPVISNDSAGPIAARIVLVPLERHVLTQNQKSVKNDPEKDLKKYLISTESTEEYDKYIDEINHNLSDVFKQNGPDYIFRLISNMSLTTLKGRPDDPNLISKHELIYRQLAHRAGFDVSAVEALMDRALKEIPSLGDPPY